MKKYNIRLLSLVLLMILICSCSSFQTKMSDLSTTTGSVTTRIEDACQNNEIVQNASNESVLLKATEDTPYERRDFGDYSFQTKCIMGHAVMLVCTKDGKQALVEDTACKLGPDKKHWESKIPVPCFFTITEQYIQNQCR